MRGGFRPVCVRGLLTVVVLVTAGCGSFRFYGSKVDGVDGQKQGFPCKFRLVSYSFSQAMDLDGKDLYECQLWSIPVAAGRMSKDKMEFELLKRHPDIFSGEPDAVPIAISVIFRERQRRALPLSVQFVTSLAGILPFTEIDLHEVCEVRLELIGGKDFVSEKSETVHFSSQKRVSPLSPLALIKSGNEERGGCFREWQGISVPQIHDFQQEVFNEVVVASVVTGLRRLDSNDLGRRAVMQNLREGGR